MTLFFQKTQKGMKRKSWWHVYTAFSYNGGGWGLGTAVVTIHFLCMEKSSTSSRIFCFMNAFVLRAEKGIEVCDDMRGSK